MSDFIRIVATAAGEVREIDLTRAAAHFPKLAKAPYGVLPLQYDHLPECGPDATFSIAVPPEAAVERRRQDSKSR